MKKLFLFILSILCFHQTPNLVAAENHLNPFRAEDPILVPPSSSEVETQVNDNDSILDDSVWDAFTCDVTRLDDRGSGSLRDLAQRFNEGSACQHNILFNGLTPPHLQLNQTLFIESRGLLLSGADFSSEASSENDLGVIIDGRRAGAVCLIQITHPSENVLQHLTLYVASNPEKAICNEAGQSLLHRNSPAYDARYSHIRVCHGNTTQTCEEAPLSNAVPTRVEMPVIPTPPAAPSQGNTAMTPTVTTTNPENIPNENTQSEEQEDNPTNNSDLNDAANPTNNTNNENSPQDVGACSLQSQNTRSYSTSLFSFFGISLLVFFRLKHSQTYTRRQA